MQEILVLSSNKYHDSQNINYGDCIIINTGTEIVIYDCGSEEHAKQVITYMEKNDVRKATVILSHNDADHFNGIPTLIAKGKVGKIYTTLLLKYKAEILKKIDDGRRTRDAIGKKILDYYSNIEKLSGENIVDIYESDSKICDGVEIVGPKKDYMLNTVAKHLDGREGDTMDSESAFNASSIQVSVAVGANKVLLCGDCSYAAIEHIIKQYQCIQLPHHGKSYQAEQIFEKKKDISTIYFVSDNTGTSNGGSDNLKTRGKQVLNTKDGENIIIDYKTFQTSSYTTTKTLGAHK